MKTLVLLLYGEEYANLALADELTLDGYEVRRASDPVTLRAACDTREIDVLILGQAARRGCGLEVLRQLRAGALAPQAEPGLRALWVSPNGELGDVLRGFEAGADDVIRTPYDYPELRGFVSSTGARPFSSTPVTTAIHCAPAIRESSFWNRKTRENSRERHAPAAPGPATRKLGWARW